MKIIFLGGRQVGIIGLLTTLASGCEVKAVVSKSRMLCEVSESLSIPVYDSIHKLDILLSYNYNRHLLSDVDILISVHSREIIPTELLKLTKYGGINVHPCLYKYKGKGPISRLLADGETKASVGVHRMTEVVDEGEALYEQFVSLDGQKTVVEVYNTLYPYYSLVLSKALKIIQEVH